MSTVCPGFRAVSDSVVSVATGENTVTSSKSTRGDVAGVTDVSIMVTS